MTNASLLPTFAQYNFARFFISPSCTFNRNCKSTALIPVSHYPLKYVPTQARHCFICSCNDFLQIMSMLLLLLSWQHISIFNSAANADDFLGCLMDGNLDLSLQVVSVWLWQIKANPHFFESDHFQLDNYFIISDALTFNLMPKLYEIFSRKKPATFRIHYRKIFRGRHPFL